MQRGLKSRVVLTEDAEAEKTIASMVRCGAGWRTKELIGQVPRAWKTNLMIYYEEV